MRQVYVAERVMHIARIAPTPERAPHTRPVGRDRRPAGETERPATGRVVAGLHVGSELRGTDSNQRQNALTARSP